MTPGTNDRTGAPGLTPATIFLATREHGLAMCRAIAERLDIPVEQRILVVADTSNTAEVEPSFPAVQQQALRAQFARVVDWNALIWPSRAHGFDCVVGSMEARLLASALCPAPAVGVRLVVESIQVPPARALTSLFPAADLHVYADGLMTYGSRRLSPAITRRISTIHYRDLIPPLRPRLIDYEAHVNYQPYAIDEVERFAGSVDVEGPALTGRTGVVALQYLSGLELISADEERALAERMIAAAQADGCSSILVKDHPAHPGLAATAIASSGVSGTSAFPDSAPLEQWMIGLSDADRRQLTIYSCFSTALPSALTLGVRAVAVGTDLLLRRIPRPNGNYLPTVICDSVCETVPFTGPIAVRPARAVPAADGALELTLEALAFAAAPAAHWATRPQLAARLRERPADQREHLGRYLRRSVLRSVGLGEEASVAVPPTLGTPPSTPPLCLDDEAFALTMVVPGRNVEPFVGTLSGTIAANSGPSIEWILIDDGSDDGSAQHLELIAERQPNVTVIRFGEPAGPSAARNAGIRRARGRYIGFLDADDWIAPGHLETVVAETRRYNVDLLRYSYVKVGADLTALVRQPVDVLDSPVNPRDYILPLDQTTSVDLPQPWLSVCRRSFLLGHELFFDADLHTAEDREWTWRVFLAAQTMVVSSAVGYYWRRGTHPSLTRIGDARQLQFLDAFARVIRRLENGPDQVFLPKAHRSVLMIGIGQLTKSDRLAPGLSTKAVFGLRQVIRQMSAEDLLLATVSLPAWRKRLVSLMSRRLVNPLAVITIARQHRPPED